MVLTAGLLASCSTVNAQKGEGAKQQDAAAKVSGEKKVPGLNTKSIDSVKKDKPAAGGQSTEAQAEPLARTDRPNTALSNTIGAKLGEDIAAVIADATHVEYVDISSQPTAATEGVQGHPVTGPPKRLNTDALKTLKTTLLSEASYKAGRARCRFRPSHGFIFRAGLRQTSVLFASKRKCFKVSVPSTPKRKNF